MKKIIIIIGVVIVVILGIYYFISSNKSKTNIYNISSNNQVNNPNTSETSSSEVVVNIRNLAFNPKILKIKAGTKVTWINDDPMAHTIASDSDNILNSPTLSSGQSFNFTFNNIGTTNYHCNIHKSMQGVVIVE